MRGFAWIAALHATCVPAFGAVISSGPSVAAEQRALEYCSRPPVQVDSLLKDPVVREDLQYLPIEETRELVLYHSCRALQGAPGGCEGLLGLAGNLKGSVPACREFESLARVAHLMVRGGDAAAACAAMAETIGQRGAGVKKGCSALVAAARSGDSLAACPVMVKEQLFGPSESCQESLTVLALNGRASDCSVIRDAFNRRFCADVAGLVAGLRDETLCAASPACQALAAGNKAACDPLGRAFSSALCAWARRAPEQRVRAQKAFEEKERQLAQQTALEQKKKTEALLQAETVRKAEAQQKKDARARAEARKKEAAEADALAKAEAKRKADLLAAARAAVAPPPKPQFNKGEAMEKMPKGVKEAMKKLEMGLPPQKPSSGGIDVPAAD